MQIALPIVTCHVTTPGQNETEDTLSSVGYLDSGSGREIPVKCHGTGVWHGIFTTQNTGSGQIPGCCIILSVVFAALRSSHYYVAKGQQTYTREIVQTGSVNHD